MCRSCALRHSSSRASPHSTANITCTHSAADLKIITPSTNTDSNNIIHIYSTALKETRETSPAHRNDKQQDLMLERLNYLQQYEIKTTRLYKEHTDE